jgi:hypothetical protein
LRLFSHFNVICACPVASENGTGVIRGGSLFST